MGNYEIAVSSVAVCLLRIAWERGWGGEIDRSVKYLSIFKEHNKSTKEVKILNNRTSTGVNVG